MLAWIKQLLDHALGSAAWVIIAVVAFPVGLILFYLTQQRRDRVDSYQETGDGT